MQRFRRFPIDLFQEGQPLLMSLLCFDAVGQPQAINIAQLRQVDGSGLSSMNQVTLGQLAVLLLAARNQPWFAAWHNALPVAAGELAMMV